jgi:hypothetical protein
VKQVCRRDLTIVVPTRDSSRWIALTHSYYQRLGISPLYCVHSKSADNTKAILSRLGANVETITSDVDHLEPMLPLIRDVTKTPWILRIDDDELPSRSLLRWVQRGRFSGQVAIRRVWLRFVSGWWRERLEYVACKSWDSASSQNGEDRQFRLYQRDRVTYDPRIHTPGFHITKPQLAPRRAVLYHLHWILRSKAEREEKVARCGSHGHFYLLEHIGKWDYSGTVRDRLVRRLALSLLSPGPRI